jgi:hypothetical protein
MSGQGGSGGNRTAGTCAYQCDDPYDCTVPYREFVCNMTRMRCEDPLIVCDDNADCIPATSLWFTPCSNDTGCLAGRSCVAVLDGGRCALNATGGTTCGAGTEPVAWQRFGAVGTVVVCQDSSGRCDRGVCRDNCSIEGCTASDRGSVCNATSGLCGCNAHSDCTGLPGVSVCNTTSHLCECANDDDCDSRNDADICVDGRCGCSGAEVCEDSNPHYMATPVCE